jgi:hypothetical protein
MNTLSILLTITIGLLFCSINQVSAYEQKQDLPLLQNPFSQSYLKENLKKTKPRLIYNEQIVKTLKAKIKSDPVIKNMYGVIRHKAYAILDKPVIERIKNSNSMLNISRGLLGRINLLGLVYLVEEDKVMLNRINQEVLSTCEFSDWNPPVYLDTAEISMAIALALDWTQDRLPESTIKKAKKALIEKGIYPSWAEHGGDMTHAWWIDHYNNWNQVCSGGMIAASIAIAEDDPELAAKTIKRSMASIPHVLTENYNPEGVCPEGVMYWAYTSSYALLTTSMLETSFGSDFGYREYPGFMKSANYRVMCGNLPSNWLYNYGDCTDQFGSGGDIFLAWFAVQTGKSMYFEKEKFLSVKNDTRLSYLTAASLAWMCRYEEKSNEQPPLAWVGKGRSPVAVFKGDASNRDYYFGAKGGCGAVSQGNMDAGSFIFELNGVRWSVDPGSQSYAIGEQGFDLWKQHQESERWQLLTKNNHGHSTITVDDQRHEVDGYALVDQYSTGKNPSVTFNLTPTFKGQLKSAFRTFTKDSERSLLIEDKIISAPSTKMVTWQLITQADVELTRQGAILKQEGQTLKLTNLSHPDIKFTIVPLDPPPHKLDKRIDQLKRIELRIPVESNGDPVHIKTRLTGHKTTGESSS